MPLQASKKVPVPQTSVPSFIFGSPTASLSEEPIILDAERPDDRFISLKSYRHWSQCLAKGLRGNGLHNGDRVLFISGNSVAWPIPFMGALMAGGVITSVSPDLPLGKLLRLAKELEPTLILASESALVHASRTAQALGLAEDSVFLFDRECLFVDATLGHSTVFQKPQRHWKELLEPTGELFDWTQHAASPDQLAAINYTSGSTGLSKGVMVSHGNIIANAIQYVEQQKDDPLGPEAGIPHNWVIWTPFYHVIGQNQFCVIAPMRGIRNHIMEKFALEPLLKFTEKYRPTHMLLLPPLLITMLSHPVAKKYDLSSVVTVSVGGSPLRLPIVERFEAFMPNADCRVIQGWGMTEITCVVANRNPQDCSSSQCIGELLPNVEAKVMTPDGTTELVGPHRSGELWIRSPNVTKGYWRDPERTAAVYMPDGWLRTGDFGYYDEQHRFYIGDRIQDITYPASAPGSYVLPTNLESVLLSIPGVVDAGVASVRLDGQAEPVPRGFVMLDDSKGVTVEAVDRAFNDKVAPHERLIGGLYAIKEVPKLPNWRVNRANLREMSV